MKDDGRVVIWMNDSLLLAENKRRIMIDIPRDANQVLEYLAFCRVPECAVQVYSNMVNRCPSCNAAGLGLGSAHFEVAAEGQPIYLATEAANPYLIRANKHPHLFSDHDQWDNKRKD